MTCTFKEVSSIIIDGIKFSVNAAEGNKNCADSFSIKDTMDDTGLVDNISINYIQPKELRDLAEMLIKGAEALESRYNKENK